MKNQIISVAIAAVAMISLPACHTTTDGVSTALVGDGIARFVPDGYDSSSMPSLMLQSEPTEVGSLPADWSIIPEFETVDGKTNAVVRLHEKVSLYGGGEVVGPLLRNGQTITLWNTDNSELSRFDNGKRLYQTHPWVIGVRDNGTAFGVLFDTTWKAELITADDFIRLNTEGTPFRVFVIDRQSPQDVVKGLAELTGYMEMPPRWALGYHQCRYSYDTEAKVRNIASNFRTRRLPCDVIWMDIDYMDRYHIFTFNPTTFPDPKKLNDDLHADNFKTVYMIDPGATADSTYFVYNSGKEKDVWVKTVAGDDYIGDVWPGPCVFPDFTRPETRQWWAGLYADFMAMGIDGVWNDMNEPSVFYNDRPEAEKAGTMPLDNVHRGGGNLPEGSHLMYHNAYGRLMVEATRDGVMAANPDKRPFVLSRANLVGGQRFAAAWTGDNVGNVEQMKMAVPMSLTFGLSGQPFNGPDIGGFHAITTGELWSNWIGYGVFLPFARGHACIGTNDKEPWAYGPEAEAVSRGALERRYRLLPYLYTCFYDAHTTGLPIMQPLFFTDPTDLNLRAEEQVFTVGTDLLVIPSFAENPSLPSGIWEDLSLVDGDITDKYQARLKIKGGSIIPAGGIIQSTEENSLSTTTLYVCLDDKGRASGRLYWDAGNGWSFRDGDYALLTFEAKRSGNEVAISVKSTEGRYPVANEISSLNVCLLYQGKAYTAAGTLSDGVMLSL